MAQPIQGQCGCGTVRFQLASRPRMAVNCHCSICRGMNGTAFSTYAVLPEKFLDVQSGADAIARYGFGGQGQKHFCRVCGTPLYNLNARYPGYAMVYLGALDAAEIVPAANIYCRSGLPWVFDLKALACHDEAMST